VEEESRLMESILGGEDNDKDNFYDDNNKIGRIELELK